MSKEMKFAKKLVEKAEKFIDKALDLIHFANEMIAKSAIELEETLDRIDGEMEALENNKKTVLKSLDEHADEIKANFEKLSKFTK